MDNIYENPKRNKNEDYIPLALRSQLPYPPNSANKVLSEKFCLVEGVQPNESKDIGNSEPLFPTLNITRQIMKLLFELITQLLNFNIKKKSQPRQPTKKKSQIIVFSN